MLVRIFLNHRSSGRNPLQMYMVQDAHQNGPNARYQKAARSFGFPPNQAMKFSVRYENPTIEPVSRHSFARFSKCLTVMSSSRPNSVRIGVSSVITMPHPEQIAPATKYGAKIVACQPGTMPIAKSHDTTECTDSTSGVESAA